MLYKCIYPQPDFFPESYKYVTAAQEGLTVHFRSAGYACFLRMLHLFSTSANLVVWVQYLLLACAFLFLYHTTAGLFYFRSRGGSVIALMGLALNPLIPVLSNQIGCEAVFTAAELVWFALLLWVIKRHTTWALILNVLILCLLLLLKGHVAHLLLLTILAFLFAENAGWKYKLTGMLTTVIAIGAIGIALKKQIEKVTGTAVYSGLHGWQIANNALYIHQYVEVEQGGFKDPQLQAIDSLANEYFASMSPALQRHFEAEKVGSDFLWDNNAPLKKYLALYREKSQQPYLNAWYQVSVPFEQYGRAIIYRHPGVYFRHFMLPNSKNFIYPNPESLAEYGAFHEAWPEETIAYFDIKKEAVHPVDKSGLQHLLIVIYRVLHALAIAFCFATPVIYLLLTKPLKEKRLVIYWLLFVSISIVFSVATSFVLLRNEGVWLVLALSLPLWFFGEMIIVNKSNSH